MLHVLDPCCSPSGGGAYLRSFSWGRGGTLWQPQQLQCVKVRLHSGLCTKWPRSFPLTHALPGCLPRKPTHEDMGRPNLAHSPVVPGIFRIIQTWQVHNYRNFQHPQRNSVPHNLLSLCLATIHLLWLIKDLLALWLFHIKGIILFASGFQPS